jgi:hypothetical protein
MARAQTAPSVMKDCKVHGLTRHAITGTRKRVRCSQCENERIKRHKREIKQTLVAERGGACERCGYDKCVAALTFHHRDPTEKAFQVGRGNRSLARHRDEAAKCDLLCANCHAELHFIE